MLSRIVLFALSTSFLGGAVVFLVGELRALPLINFARAVERSQTLPFADVALQWRLQVAIGEPSTCHHLTARSRVTTALFLFNRSVADGAEAALVRTRLDHGRKAVLHALACNPLDGNLWLLAGWLGRFSDPNLGTFHEFMAMSVRLAPYEGRILDKRWSVLASQFPKIGLASDSVFHADLLNLLAHSRPKTAAATLMVLRANGGTDITNAVLAQLSAKRRQQLQDFINPSRPLDRKAKYRSFDLTPLITPK